MRVTPKLIIATSHSRVVKHVWWLLKWQTGTLGILAWKATRIGIAVVVIEGYSNRLWRAEKSSVSDYTSAVLLTAGCVISRQVVSLSLLTGLLER